MAKPTKHFLTRIADRVGGEIERDTEALSSRLADELLDDRTELSEPKFLELFRQRFGSDPHFAPAMRARMGDTAFNAAYAAAFGIPQRELTLARLLADRHGATGDLGESLVPTTAPAVAPPVAPDEAASPITPNAPPIAPQATQAPAVPLASGPALA